MDALDLYFCPIDGQRLKRIVSGGIFKSARCSCGYNVKNSLASIEIEKHMKLERYQGTIKNKFIDRKYSTG